MSSFNPLLEVVAEEEAEAGVAVERKEFPKSLPYAAFPREQGADRSVFPLGYVDAHFDLDDGVEFQSFR